MGINDKKKFVSWTPDALDSFNDSVEFLEHENHFIARSFAKQIKETIKNFKVFPFIGLRGRVSDTRELKVQNYPYFIVYRVNEEFIEVLLILHTSKKYPI